MNKRTRHAAHVIRSSHEAARLVRDATDIDTLDDALAALAVVAGAIVRRVNASEAADLIAQLPNELKEPLLDLPAGPDTNITLETVQAELATRLGVEDERAAKLVPRIGLALRQLIGSGERADLESQLPPGLRAALLPDEVAHPTP
jgi:uncharacterized protein (DUF2267 family)